ncbi:MAG: hypothetical protein HC906_09020 [Bacteroidales bacterium]|nr:hypothetical protein [Bacteroidales bacterium]
MDYEILPDIVEYYGLGGDHENKPPTILSQKGVPYSTHIQFTAPDKEGPYRFFVYVKDKNNNAGVANIPFYVGKPGK